MSSAGATTSLLFVGDMHLGRSPSRIPPHVPFLPRELGPEEAWSRTVALALEKRVAALVLAGDVVESLEDRFTADFVLSPGLEKLQASGIPVYAVVGNHDVHALPRLARRNSGLKLLGNQEAWSCVTICHEGKEVCRLLGWSFRQQRETGNPLDTLTLDDTTSDLPVLGVLHCDWGQSQGSYAPVPQAGFDSGPASRVAGWFLGHVHKASLDHGNSRPVGYLGSLAALDPGEPGPHGPWLVSPVAGGISLQQIPLAPVRYDTLHLDVSTITEEDAEDLRDALQEAFKLAARAWYESLPCGGQSLRACALRLHVHGRHEHPSRVNTLLRELHGHGDLRTEQNGTSLFAEALRSTVKPALKVSELASGQGPLAPLASFLQEESEDGTLERDLQDLVNETAARGAWSELDLDQYPRPPAEEIIQDAAWELLCELHDDLRKDGGLS